jgi:hypothetical protein
MDPSILAEVKRLVTLECANYQKTGPMKTQNYCWGREKSQDGICDYFLKELKKCAYFEKCVLPINPGLEDDYNETGRVAGGERTGEESEGVPANDVRVPTPRVAMDKIRTKSILRRG